MHLSSSDRLSLTDDVDEIHFFNRSERGRLEGNKNVVFAWNETLRGIDRFDNILFAKLIDQRPWFLNFSSIVVDATERPGVRTENPDFLFGRRRDVA